MKIAKKIEKMRSSVEKTMSITDKKASVSKMVIEKIINPVEMKIPRRGRSIAPKAIMK